MNEHEITISAHLFSELQLAAEAAGLEPWHLLQIILTDENISLSLMSY